MNKKAQAQIGLGVIMVTFIAILVGVILFQAIAQEAGKATTSSVYNTTSGSAAITCPADTITIDLEGQELLSTPLVRNASGDLVIQSGNYTIDEGVSTTTGVKTIRYTAIGSEFAGNTLNISYDYGRDGYIDNSGGRAMAGLIAIFFALAVAVIALTPTLRSGVLNMMGK